MHPVTEATAGREQIVRSVGQANAVEDPATARPVSSEVASCGGKVRCPVPLMHIESTRDAPDRR
jgi:hypothetical protein